MWAAYVAASGRASGASSPTHVVVRELSTARRLIVSCAIMDISHVIMQCVTDGDANSLGRALRLWKRQASYPAVVEGIVYMAAVPGFPGVSTCLQAAVGSVTDVNGSEGWIGVLCHLLRVAGHDKEWINEREQGSLATALHHVCLRPTVIDGEDDDAKMRARQREILLGVVLLLLYGADARAKSRVSPALACAAAAKALHRPSVVRPFTVTIPAYFTLCRVCITTHPM